MLHQFNRLILFDAVHFKKQYTYNVICFINYTFLHLDKKHCYTKENPCSLIQAQSWYGGDVSWHWFHVSSLKIPTHSAAGVEYE